MKLTILFHSSKQFVFESNFYAIIAASFTRKCFQKFSFLKSMSFHMRTDRSSSRMRPIFVLTFHSTFPHQNGSHHMQVHLKAGFHMIADRRSQIAIRSAIVCDHMETTSAIVCDPAIAIADDRRR